MKQKYCFMHVVIIVLISTMLSSCSFMKSPFVPKEIVVQLIPQNSAVEKTYKNLDKEISINIKNTMPRDYPTIDRSELSKKSFKTFPDVTYTQTITAFAKDATTDYMQRMRFDVVPVADYCLEIVINNFLVVETSKDAATASIYLTYRLVDNAGQAIIPTTSVKISGDGLRDTWGQLYFKALNQINWDRIAKCLTVGDTPKDEKKAQVKGNGDTALEHTVIRWFITSAPQGADVTWRIVSSSPEVANTNSNFIGTTPYESTESFDIRGLTYENSGNVQIEISCEKPGYMTQRKRFNLRQAIDQKEISAKFNLIPDE